MVAAPELQYNVDVSQSKEMYRDVMIVNPDGAVSSNSRLASFKIEGTQSQLIHPETVSVCGTFEGAANSNPFNSLASIVDSVTVYTQSGQTVSHQPQFWRLHSVLSDLTLDQSHADAAWQQGLDLRGNGTTLQTAQLAARQFSIPLTVSGLFSSQKLICPADFGGLRVQVRFRAPIECMYGSADSKSYTLKDVHLKYEWTDISRDPKMLAVYSKPTRMYHFLQQEVYESAVQASATVARVPCPSRMRSIRKATLAFFRKGTGSEPLAEIRTSLGITALQSRVGTQLFPQDKIRGYSNLYDVTQSAYGGALRGFLTRERYEGQRFVAAVPYSNLKTHISGMDPRDAVLELFADVTGQADTTAVVFLQGDAVWDSASQQVDQ